MQKTKARGMKGVLDCEMIRRILVGDFAFEIRNYFPMLHASA